MAKTSEALRAFSSLLRFVAIRHVLSSPLRAALTLIGVALGVAMVVGTSASNAAVLSAFGEMVDRAGGKADLEITGDESGVDQALVDEVGAHTEIVSHVAGRIEQTSYLEGGERVLVLGLDLLGDKEFLPLSTESGADVIKDPLAFLNDPNAILIGDAFARAHGLGPGGAVKLRTAHGMEEFHVETVLRETGKTRAFGGQVVVLFIDAAQLAFERQGRVDRIDIALAPGVREDDGKRALAGIVGDRGVVDRPSRRAAQLERMTNSFRGGLQIVAMVAVLVGMFLIYNAVSVSVAQRRREIGMLRSLGATRAQIAAVFLSEAVFVGLLGGALGVLLGAALARAVVAQFAPNVSRFFDNIAAPEVTVTPRMALVGALVSVGATLVASWIPARRASRVSPVEALRRDRHTGARGALPLRKLFAFAVVMAAAALALTRVAATQSLAASVATQSIGLLALTLLFAAGACATPVTLAWLSPLLARAAQRVFGVAARLGIETIERQLGQSSGAACALMLATALSVTMAAFTRSFEESAFDWIDESVRADLLVTAGSPTIDRNTVAFASEWAAKAADVPGVRAVNGLRTISIPYAGLRPELLSLDTRMYLGELVAQPERRVLVSPARLDADALTREPAVLVSESFAWHTRAKVGDALELPSPTGAHAFRVAGVFRDYSSPDGLLMIDRSFYVSYWNDDRLEALHVYLKDPHDADHVSRALSVALSAEGSEDVGLFVVSNAAFKDEVRRVMRQTFGVSKSSEVVALAVAALGVIGTMLAQVLDRVREIGVLRAVGATRRQIVAAIVAEAGVLGAVAALVAVVTAYPAAYVFVRVLGLEASGWSVPFRFDAVAAARVGASVVALALLSGLLPGIRAARLRIAAALAWE